MDHIRRLLRLCVKEVRKVEVEEEQQVMNGRKHSLRLLRETEHCSMVLEP